MKALVFKFGTFVLKLFHTWYILSEVGPIQTFPGTGGVRSTVIPSLHLFTSNKVSVHFSCSTIVAGAWIQIL